MAEDDTIRMKAPARAPAPVAPPPRRRPVLPLLAAAALLVAAGLGWAWWAGFFAPAPRPVAETPPPPPAIAPPPQPAPAADPGRLATLPPLLDEAAILAHRAEGPRLLRLSTNPAVFVIDFPTLEWQGAALNRVAALVEKAGLPRDRVLSPEEMAAAIARAGDTAATYYFGHNYTGAVLARFFRLAARDGVALSPQEAWVEAQLRLARGLVPEGQEIAILTVAAPGGRMDAAWRATVLRHELGHGLFATNPAYADHVRRVWRERFTEAERAAFRAFLAREEYDTANEEMVVDEAQAYLLHTPDPRFFSPAHVGMDEAGVERLRALLREGAPGLPR